MKLPSSRSAIPLLALLATFAAPATALAQRGGEDRDSQPQFKTVLPKDDARITKLKQDAVRMVDSMSLFTQHIVDQIFSFGELGFHEVETSKYLTGILEKEGFAIQRGVYGIPTAWIAKWGSGKPVLALGSDIDGIPKASQKPGVAYRDPMVVGGPGHGEGHNSGQAVNITAAVALKRIMERDKIPGTIMLWPGVAEELVGTKAYYVREGMFKDVDAALFTHVGNNLATSWGSQSSNGLVSLEYTFKGQSAHAAGAPWRGRSALDAVELMDVAWNFRREHLRYQQRSHYVVTDGGDQPNVVPQQASVWYYLRETDYPHIKEMWAILDSIALGASLMTSTSVQPVRVLGSAWPQYFNKPIAEAMYENIKHVGLPKWSEDDQTLAKALQCEIKAPQRGLATKLGPLEENVPESRKTGGGSDDIGDVSWALPTITLRFPSNIPGLPGHNWTDAIAMATPIAHKGATAGAKAMAMTMVDLYTKPTILSQAWDFYRTVQTKNTKYEPLIRQQDKPAIDLNADVEKFRPEMQKYYYDASKYSTYLEQLGIKYPTTRACGNQVSN